jgi:hypothetical protein
MTDDTPTSLPRPKELALLLLASGDLMPRQRARDQQADIAGLELKRAMLHALVARDPEPEELELALAEAVATHGDSVGPARAIALSILDDWQAAHSPAFVAWLLEEAIVEGQRPAEGRRGKRRRGQVAAFEPPHE